MCRKITCDRCGKPSFAGCGAHVEQVLKDVPKEDRCQCAATAARPGDAQGGLVGWLQSLLR